jgi:hypothetical protein
MFSEFCRYCKESNSKISLVEFVGWMIRVSRGYDLDVYGIETLGEWKICHSISDIFFYCGVVDYSQELLQISARAETILCLCLRRYKSLAKQYPRVAKEVDELWDRLIERNKGYGYEIDDATLNGTLDGGRYLALPEVA